jgi:hypothetical protein
MPKEKATQALIDQHARKVVTPTPVWQTYAPFDSFFVLVSKMVISGHTFLLEKVCIETKYHGYLDLMLSLL